MRNIYGCIRNLFEAVNIVSSLVLTLSSLVCVDSDLTHDLQIIALNIMPRKMLTKYNKRYSIFCFIYEC